MKFVKSVNWGELGADTARFLWRGRHAGYLAILATLGVVGLNNLSVVAATDINSDIEKTNGHCFRLTKIIPLDSRSEKDEFKVELTQCSYYERPVMPSWGLGIQWVLSRIEAPAGDMAEGLRTRVVDSARKVVQQAGKCSDTSIERQDKLNYRIVCSH